MNNDTKEWPFSFGEQQELVLGDADLEIDEPENWQETLGDMFPALDSRFFADLAETPVAAASFHDKANLCAQLTAYLYDGLDFRWVDPAERSSLATIYRQVERLQGELQDLAPRSKHSLETVLWSNEAERPVGLGKHWLHDLQDQLGFLRTAIESWAELHDWQEELQRKMDGPTKKRRRTVQIETLLSCAQKAFEKSGAVITRTRLPDEGGCPVGDYANFLRIIWSVLPEDKRPGKADTFVRKGFKLAR